MLQGWLSSSLTQAIALKIYSRTPNLVVHRRNQNNIRRTTISIVELKF